MLKTARASHPGRSLLLRLCGGSPRLGLHGRAWCFPGALALTSQRLLQRGHAGLDAREPRLQLQVHGARFRCGGFALAAKDHHVHSTLPALLRSSALAPRRPRASSPTSTTQVSAATSSSRASSPALMRENSAVSAAFRFRMASRRMSNCSSMTSRTASQCSRRPTSSPRRDNSSSSWWFTGDLRQGRTRRGLRGRTPVRANQQVQEFRAGSASPCQSRTSGSQGRTSCRRHRPPSGRASQAP